MSSNIDESASTEDRLQELMLAILGDDTEVCTKSFLLQGVIDLV